MNRIFSGIQPTGNLHLGNYLGAIKNWVDLQESYECIYCIVDMHAITVPHQPSELKNNTREVTASLIAAGIDPKRSIIFNQSKVSAHAELAWIFNCISKLGWLNRMTQFKDKSGKNKENVSAGLYVYPNLMAADILAYHATHVPVGEDQKQHLELTRDIANSFNDTYGNKFFPLVEPLIFGAAPRVMSLRDGFKKMSKSDQSDFTRINLIDDAETIVLKFQKARTDPNPLPESVEGLNNRAEATNLVGIYAGLSNSTKEDVLSEHGGSQFSSFKKSLADLAIESLSPITSEMRKLMKDVGLIDEILKDGSEKAEEIAEPILVETKKILGFLNVK
tara:strand:+ start:964 stop:1965 length:1002 start_codon:yes stop_codon:yes gene_type:complete